MPRSLYFCWGFTLDRRLMRGREWSRVDGAFFAATALYFCALVPYGLNLDDEGTLLYQIYRTALGHRLYSDFHAGYTPGVYWWNAFLFQLFGVNVLYVRFVLAIVNSLAVYLIYALAQRLGAKRWPAALVAWCYVTLIPYYDGQFFSANIPYPIWYVTLFWLVALRFVLGWWEQRSTWYLFAAGLATGAVLGFKPNSGILAGAGCAAAVAALVQITASSPRAFAPLYWFVRITAGLLPFLVLVGLVSVVRGAGGTKEILAVVLPLLAMVVLAAFVPRGVRRPVAWTQAVTYALAFVGGIAVVSAPWVVHYWRQLGTAPFFRATLFVGTDFAKFYFVPYPSWSAFGWATVVAVSALVVTLWALRQRLLPGRVVVWSTVGLGTVALAAVWMRPPPMVEGFSASVVMRLRDIAFPLALLTLWLGLARGALVVWRLRRALLSGDGPDQAPARPLRELPAFVVVLFGAILMHVQLYPRMDFMHLVPAVPALLVIAGVLVSRFSERFAVVVCQGIARGRQLGRWALAPIAVVIVAVTLPAWQRALYVWSVGLRDSDALARLHSPRAPLVVEPAAARLFLSLNETVRWLTANSAPGEFVFTFPVLDVVSFLADRHNPTRHGYFYPGWPGHEVEAEVIDALRARPPRFVVTLHDHPLFFASAPVYYFNLRNYITKNYRLARQVGMFDILAPRSDGDLEPVDLQPLTPDRELWIQELRYRHGRVAHELEGALKELEGEEPELLARRLAGESPAVQHLAVTLIRKSRSATGAAALALLWEQGQLGRKTEELALRTIAEVGDASCVAPLLRLYEAVPSAREKVAGLLYHISGKLAFAAYWFSQEWRAGDERLGALEAEQLAAWADNPFQSLALRLFAVRAAAHLETKAMVPVLVRLIGDRSEWPDLSVQAADTLSALRLARPLSPAIVRLLRLEQLWVPAVVAANWSADDDEGRAALESEMTNPRAEVRAAAFWIAAGVRDPALQPALEAGLGDGLVEVRMAAAWGLGELGQRSAVSVLEKHLSDPDDRVQTFVRGALAKLGVPVPAVALGS